MHKLTGLLAVVLLAGAVAAPAQASLVGDDVDITFASPNETDPFTPFTLTDNDIVVGAGNEIQTGDSTNIGGSGFTLSEEFLDIQSDRIILQLESGGTDDGNGNLTTGFASGAYWDIADLDFSGGTITGFDLELTDITNFTLADILFSGGSTASFRIFISDLWITDQDPGFDVGQIKLILQTSPSPPAPVPLPAAAWLLLSGLGALGLLRKRAR